jgi:hypothetical protein
MNWPMIVLAPLSVMLARTTVRWLASGTPRQRVVDVVRADRSTLLGFGIGTAAVWIVGEFIRSS